MDAWLRENKFSEVDFIEIFSGSGHLSSEMRRSGLSVAPGIDREYESYGRRWDLADLQDRGLCEALLLRLKPRALHYGLPCDPYSILGQGTPSDGDVQVLSWTLGSMEGHHSEGRLVTLENPVGSQVWHRQEMFKLCGSLLEPKFPWNFVRTDACQYGMESPALDDGSKGMAVEKGQIWLGNYCLSGLSLVCKRPDSLAVIVHEHRHVRGSMKVAEGGGTRWVGFGAWSGKYERACCAAYAACVLRAMKLSVSVMLGQEILTSPEEVPKNDTRSPTIPRTSNQPSERVQVEPPIDVKSNEDLSHEERERLDREVRELSKKMEALWRSRAESKQWDEVKADLGVYRLSGQSVKEDPRRSSDYRNQVVEGLGFGKDALEKRPGMSEQDILACREVLYRKSGGFWLEGSPRTTVRNVLHDCVPTGPPISQQPHNLKGEAAAWVDEKFGGRSPAGPVGPRLFSVGEPALSN